MAASLGLWLSRGSVPVPSVSLREALFDSFFIIIFIYFSGNPATQESLEDLPKVHPPPGQCFSKVEIAN